MKTFCIEKDKRLCNIKRRCPNGLLQSPIGTRKVGTPCKDDIRFAQQELIDIINVRNKV